MKILSPTVHGILDYVVVAFLWLSPSLFGLPDMAATFAYVLGGIHLVLSLCTAYPPGLFKVIPLPVHGWIELIVSIALVAVAFFLGSEEGALARNFYLCIAAVVFITWLITDYGSQKLGSV